MPGHPAFANTIHIAIATRTYQRKASRPVQTLKSDSLRLSLMGVMTSVRARVARFMPLILGAAMPASVERV